MRVGMVGLGKLGLPVATAIAARGLEVFGHDPCVTRFPEDTSHEDGLAEAIVQAEGRMHFCGLVDVVNNAEVVFVAVQTPHDPRFEGITPLPDERADFDYSYLVQACKQVGRAAEALEKRVTLAVISTVLPGTMERYVQPALPDLVKLVYNPSFIAMGTTIRDFLDPEFCLLGGDVDGRMRAIYDYIFGKQQKVKKVWTGGHLHLVPFYETSVENAELIKVAYNTFIGLKIAFANTLMEVCHKTACDVDEVTGALKLAHRRLISPAYMDGGMGDGGACHPRDNIALSWLASKIGLSHDLFDDVMTCRERQAEWLVDLMCEHNLPKGILGVAYKPGSHITTGSAALLAKVLLEDRGHPVDIWDPHVYDAIAPQDPHVFLVGCRHPEFKAYKFPAGSVVIDPFRYTPDQDGIEVIRVGSHPLGETAGGRHRLPAPVDGAQTDRQAVA